MHLTRDLRYAWRGLARSPLFTIVALASIALGIGANTAIFTLVDEVLLRALPVKNPEQLVLFDGARNHYGSNSGGNMLSFPMYEDFRDNFVDRGDRPALPRVSQPVPNPAPTPRLLSGLFARRPVAMNVGVPGNPGSPGGPGSPGSPGSSVQTERVPGELVSGTYFQVLGVRAALGRVILPEDDQARGDGYVAVLSYDYWRTRFGADLAIVGRPLMINNVRFTIIGVSQAGFDGVDIGYVPSVRVPVMLKAQMTPNWDDIDNRRSRWVNVFGRLKPGVTQEQALAALQPFFRGLLEQEVQMAPFSSTTPYTREQFLKGQMGLLPAAQGRSPIRQQLTDPLKLLFFIVGGVLLIACANVASLLIARAAARQKEIAVRLSLGASRARIVGQLLVESVMLAGAGGLLGLGVAAWTTRFLIGFLPTTTPHVISGSIDGRILLFNFLLSLATGLLFGLIPALRSTKPNLAPTLKDQVGAVVGGSGGVRLRKGLVVAQVTISILLLIGAGVFIRSLRNLRLLNLGLRTDSLIAFNVSPTLTGYTPVRTKQFDKQLLDRVAALPGITSMAFAQVGLLEGNEWDSSMSVEGYDPKPGEDMGPYCNAVSPGYFKTMGIPILSGRDFDDRNVRFNVAAPDPNALPSYQFAIVNESYARHYFGDRSPLGRHIGFGINPGTKTPIEIIGVVKDAKYTGVRDEIPRQVFFAFMENDFAGAAVMYVRTASDPDAAFGSIRQVMRELDPNIPMYNPRTLEWQVDQSLLNDRLIATLSSAFGALATLLAVIGLYGVMAYTVAQRTREIGVRMALGAVPGDVIWLVMREVLALVGSGIVLGLIGALVLKRYVGSQLYGVGANDPTTVVAAVLLLGLVALVAGYVPARRATRVSPVLALRYE
ncbi:MAG TPA: ABC transporter permease [Vicinamibacterales bacterium]|nr:ABC transporter permease [Vicinamibacterales bacterium]